MGSTQAPAPIPFALSTFPGANPQEGSGRLINCYSEPLGEANRPTGPAQQVWRRSPGLSRHAKTSQTTPFRGGLLVNNLVYAVWTGGGAQVDTIGTVTPFTGTTIAGNSKVSIARNQAATPNIVVVDPGNGAYSITSAGVVATYNGGGALPQPNSVCFQDSYFFFTIGDGRVFASGVNALTQNANTFITIQAKADVNLLRGIAYSGLLWCFTTGSCEIYQDTAQAFPAFPYTRMLVLETGLLQANAIAGWEVGFSQLAWVAQDFGVYWSTPGANVPTKISSPDLEKLIEAQSKAGNTLEAWVYTFAGKQFWVLNSPAWTWEFNFTTQRWNERSSLFGGIQAQWRATGGLPAFGKWITGDRQSGDLLFIDTSAFDERGVPQLFRVESGPVKEFPHQIRIARADFDFTMGTGRAVGNVTQSVTGAAAGAVSGAGNLVRLTMLDTARMLTGDTVNVSGVGGTIEANGTFQINVIDDQHIDLRGTQFVTTYLSGGTVVDVTSPPNAVQPQVAISCSKNGGISFDNPSLRLLGRQQRAQRARASVKSRGLSGPMGDRWRLDVTDPVYTALLGGTQASDPREAGA